MDLYNQLKLINKLLLEKTTLLTNYKQHIFKLYTTHAYHSRLPLTLIRCLLPRAYAMCHV